MAEANVLQLSDDKGASPVVTIPLKGVPPGQRSAVARVLTSLVPYVAEQVEARNVEVRERLVDVLVEGTPPRPLDLRLARLQANAIKAIWRGTEWLTAEQIGRLGGFSKSNLAAPASRWKNEGKLFAVPFHGVDQFPRYALDETLRPQPALEQILKALGPVSPVRIASWFESANAWLSNRRPREVLASDPRAVIAAAQERRTSGTHG